MLDGFEQTRIATSGAEINLRKAGQGPPLLMLHGYPQTLVMWHKIAPALAERFTVVLTDLRGYGDSAKPPGGDRHEAYSKRAMARDQAEVMTALGFEKFTVVGHDRGARVGHRLALDHPERVTKLAVLDIAPTLAMYERTDMAFASAYYHWFFLIQPYDLPERLIGADPDYYLEKKDRQVEPERGLLRRGRHRRVQALLPRPGDHPRHLRGLPGRRRHRPGPRPRQPGPPARLPAARAVGRQGRDRTQLPGARNLTRTGAGGERQGAALRSLPRRGGARGNAGRVTELPLAARNT